MTTTKYIWTLFVVSILICLSSCSISSTTTYRVKATKKTYKDCGYLLTCSYYPSEELEINILVPQTCNDRDYYYYWKGNRCDYEVILKSATVKFASKNDTLPLLTSRQGTSLYLKGKVNKNSFDPKDQLEIKISFSSGHADKVIKLKRYKLPFVDLPIIRWIAGC